MAAAAQLTRRAVQPLAADRTAAGAPPGARPLLGALGETPAATLSVLAELVAQIRRDGGPLECPVGALATAVYGYEPGGSERRGVRDALAAVAALELVLPGFNAPRGRPGGSSRARLFSAVGEERSSSGPRGGAPATVMWLEPAPWFARAVAAGGYDWLAPEVVRVLAGNRLAERVWLLLEAETFGPALTAEVRIDAILRRDLALGHRREVDARRALAGAGRRVLAADERYAQVTPAKADRGYVLRAVRQPADRGEVG